jgi:hypothetical protein
MRTATLLAALAVLPVPGAHAAMVVSSNSRTIPDYGGISTAYSVLATGDAAADDIEASGVYGDFKLPIGVLVTDKAGATAGDGCEQLDATSVRCMVPLGQIGDASVTAKVTGGAGDDAVNATGPMGMTLVGGDGADVVTGGAGPDVLLGGAGADALRGGQGSDVLDGGAGADVLDAGRGADTVEHVRRGDVVHVRDHSADVVRCGRPPGRVIADRRDRLHGCGARTKGSGAG